MATATSSYLVDPEHPRIPEATANTLDQLGPDSESPAPSPQQEVFDSFHGRTGAFAARKTFMATFTPLTYKFQIGGVDDPEASPPPMLRART